MLHSVTFEAYPLSGQGRLEFESQQPVETSRQDQRDCKVQPLLF